MRSKLNIKIAAKRRGKFSHALTEKDSTKNEIYRGPLWLRNLKSSVWFFALEVMVISAGVAGVWLAWNEARETRAFRQSVEVPMFEESMREIREASEERILQIYNFASSRESSPLARRLALEHLVTRGHSLRGINLSCEAIGEMQDFTTSNGDASSFCLVRPDLGNIDFSNANLTFANFSNANLLLSIFDGANLSGAQFFDSSWAEARFDGAWAWEGLVPPDLSYKIDICVYDTEVHQLPHDEYSERPDVC